MTLWLAGSAELVGSAGIVGGLVGLGLAPLAEKALSSRRHLALPARSAIVAVSAVLFGLTAAHFGAAAQLLPYCVFAAVAVVLGTVDLLEKRLPNAVLYPSMIVLVVLLSGTSAITGTWGALLSAFGGAAALFALYFVLAVISPSGIGMGDVKLAALIGLMLGYLGWVPLLVGGVAGFLIGGVTSVVALLSGRASLKTALPFGPAMLAGAILGIVLA